MSAPRWARTLLGLLASHTQVDEVVGDLEEAHRRRLDRHARIVATILTCIETVDMAFALVRQRRRSRLTPARRCSRLRAISWLDVKLGLRMLVKHPGLSLVSVFGMTVAVAIGATAFGMIYGMTSSSLPLDEGDRLITVQNSTDGFGAAASTHLHDIATWRAEAPAIAELGAYRILQRNLFTAEGKIAPASIVEMMASGFRIARVPPLLGRYLVDADEREGAPEVIVIGYGVWQERFGGSPDVLGETIQAGATRHTVVGVMPREFAFPINNRVWTPLRLDPLDFPVGAAPPVQVLGRLAPQATVEAARAQLAVLGLRAATAFPETHGNLRPWVFTYSQAVGGGMMAWFLYLAQLVVSMILVVIAINVAALVYARTVTRAGEIAIRTALGASRGRIIRQLFTEAFVLSSLAAGAGLLIARVCLRQIELSLRSSRGELMPFWWDFNLSPQAVVYGFGLAVVAAVIVGVFPALAATGAGLHARLQSAGSGASTRLGRTWTAIIVMQVAAAVAILPIAVSGIGRWLNSADPETTLPLDEVIVARLELDRDPARSPAAGSAADIETDWQQHYVTLRDELIRQLEAQPEVAGVAMMGTPPWRDPDLPFEVDGAQAVPLAGTPYAMGSASNGHFVGRSTVSPELFATVGVPTLAGRPLNTGDTTVGSNAAIVNETFVELVLGGGNAIGRRVRFPTRSSPGLGSRSPLAEDGAPWHTIVGVIPDFPPHAGVANPEAKAYLAMTTDYAGLATLAVRIRGGEAGQFAGPFRELAANVDPMLRLSRVTTIDAIMRTGHADVPMILLVVGGLSGSMLLMAAAGLHALMAFTVARRHREIGIRIALGARPQRVLGAILFRAAWQLALGTAVGLALSGTIDRLAGGEILGRQETLVLPAVALLMILVGIMAAWVPARRGLRIEPTEALRAE